VKSNYTKLVTADKPKDIKWGKQGKPDGVVEFKGDSSMSQSATDALDTHKENNPNFNGNENNCTDYAKAGVEGATGEKLDATEKGVNANTPNQAFKAAKDLPGATVTKAPGDSVEKGFIRGSSGDAVLKFFGVNSDKPENEAQGKNNAESQTESTTHNEKDNQ